VDTAANGGHNVLSGIYNTTTNNLELSGCFMRVENALQGPAIYARATVNAHTGQGTVDVFTARPKGCDIANLPANPPAPNNDAPVEITEQQSKPAADTGAGAWDTDQDNCPDKKELGTSQIAGGLRDPYNRWDFFDQWIGGGMDGAVVIGDIGAVVARFGSVGAPGDPKVPPALSTGYHTQGDRSGSLAGSNAWNLKAPDGAIVIGDIGAAVGQFGHAGCNAKS
jgi:hypothetical protein